VMFLGCGRTDTGDLFLVLEYCEKGDLTGFLGVADQKGMNKAPKWMVRILLLQDIAEGILYLHLEHDVVHRDLKSDNVLLTVANDRLHAKISDFGTSKRISNLYSSKVKEYSTIFKNPLEEDTGHHIGAGRTRLSKLQQTMTSATGTLLWMAPEIVADMNGTSTHYGQAADIYSFGMIMYESLELKRPWFHIQSRFTGPIIDAVLAGKRPPISQALKCRSKYIDLMIHCWDQNQDMRPTAGEVATGLESINTQPGNASYLKGRGSDKLITADASTKGNIELGACTLD